MHEHTVKKNQNAPSHKHTVEKFRMHNHADKNSETNIRSEEHTSELQSQR